MRFAACISHPFQTFKRPVVVSTHSPPAALAAWPAVSIRSSCDRMRDVLCAFAAAYFNISWRDASRGREPEPLGDSPLT